MEPKSVPCLLKPIITMIVYLTTAVRWLLWRGSAQSLPCAEGGVLSSAHWWRRDCRSRMLRIRRSSGELGTFHRTIPQSLRDSSLCTREPWVRVPPRWNHRTAALNDHLPQHPALLTSHFTRHTPHSSTECPKIPYLFRHVMPFPMLALGEGFYYNRRVFWCILCTNVRRNFLWLNLSN